MTTISYTRQIKNLEREIATEIRNLVPDIAEVIFPKGKEPTFKAGAGRDFTVMTIRDGGRTARVRNDSGYLFETEISGMNVYQLAAIYGAVKTWLNECPS